MDNRNSGKGGILDHVAIVLSGLCLLHCLLLPFIIAVLPLLSKIDESHFHAQMLIVVIPVSVFAFALGFRRHASKAIIAWGVIGAAILVFGATIAHARYGATVDTLVTMVGAIVLATTHYFNNRLTRHVAASSTAT